MLFPRKKKPKGKYAFFSFVAFEAKYHFLLLPEVLEDLEKGVTFIVLIEQLLYARHNAYGTLHMSCKPVLMTSLLKRNYDFS